MSGTSKWPLDILYQLRDSNDIHTRPGTTGMGGQLLVGSSPLVLQDLPQATLHHLR